MESTKDSLLTKVYQIHGMIMMTKLIDKTPLIMSAKKSAEVIARKLERKPAKIIFPFTLFLAVLFIKFIPSPIQNFFFKTLIVERS